MNTAPASTEAEGVTVGGARGRERSEMGDGVERSPKLFGARNRKPEGDRMNRTPPKYPSKRRHLR